MRIHFRIPPNTIEDWVHGKQDRKYGAIRFCKRNEESGGRFGKKRPSERPRLLNFVLFYDSQIEAAVAYNVRARFREAVSLFADPLPCALSGFLLSLRVVSCIFPGWFLTSPTLV